ncbi:MAG: response regulator [Spirochaetes bacterium]|nr:response regulator [Spirochaetota bacterium]
MLIVDDSPLMRAELSALLSTGGFEIAGTAVDGLEGVRRYAELEPDLVVMDVTMPRLDGISATSRIRAVDPSARVIVICGPCSHEQSREALAAGAAACIRRPLDRHRFAEQVNAGLRDIG